MLSKLEILKEIKNKNIQITPFNFNNFGPVSVDLTLSDTFRVFTTSKKAYKVSENTDVDLFSKKIKLTKGKTLKIKPKELVLGSTLEKITLSKNIVGRLTGRSRFARLGLAVHVSSDLVQPGVDNVQVLEIVNNSPYVLELIPNEKICQITFEKITNPSAVYSGKFAKQTQP